MLQDHNHSINNTDVQPSSTCHHGWMLFPKNTSVLTLSSLADLYCTMEVDSFGFFSNKAKTRVYRYTTEPKWNEVRDEPITC